MLFCPVLNSVTPRWGENYAFVSSFLFSLFWDFYLLIIGSKEKELP